jgi:hypothetical protein
MDLGKAGQRFGLLSIKDLLLVHIHYVELVSASWIATLRIGFSLDFEKEPITVAFCVRVRLQVQIEFFGLNLNRQVKVTAFKHGVEC